jgi:phosphoglycolate phosphatase
MPVRIQAVLLDLDGTLLDTAPDMVGALNRLREARGHAPLPFATVRPHVSHGAFALVRLGFPDAADSDLAELRARFLDIYRENLSAGTRLFSGFEPVLGELERRGMRWGIVTNKPAFLTEPLLDALRLTTRAACVVSGDTVPQRKPHPAPLQHAARLLALEPAACVYVGDAERDVEAARAAGMPAIVALFGYLGAEDRPESWQPDALIEEPRELLRWLDGSAGKRGDSR